MLDGDNIKDVLEYADLVKGELCWKQVPMVSDIPIEGSRIGEQNGKTKGFKEQTEDRLIAGG